MIGIYKFTNKINGKSYIGQSTNIHKRYLRHKNYLSENSRFHRAIGKYGFDNFDFEILEECSSKDLDEKEIYYIKLYNTLSPNGYNMTRGGKLPHVLNLSSTDDVDKIIDLLKNTNMSQKEIGELFGLSDQSISDINCGRQWVQDDIVYPIRVKEIRPILYCKMCGKQISKYSMLQLCNKCHAKTRITQLPVTKEQLYELLSNHPFISVGKMYGVSDAAIRKWCDKLGIPRRSSYYRKLKKEKAS